MTDLDKIYFWLSTVDGLSHKKTADLLEYFGSAENVYGDWQTKRAVVTQIAGADAYSAGLSTRKLSDLETRMREVESKKINIITPADRDFPAGVLNMTYDRPLVLYYVGEKQVFSNRGIAIVGTRECSVYGKRTARMFAIALTEAGFNIVSGLANGIDTCAHEACLEADGTTIAVLPGGLDKIVPQNNRELARRIVRKGLAVSEYPPGFIPQKYTYPHRNRLIAALSEGVLLVEAGEKSGALYTCNHAAEQNKPVFCIPGNLDSDASKGANNLIRACQALLVVSPEQILDELNTSYTKKTV